MCEHVSVMFLQVLLGPRRVSRPEAGLTGDYELRVWGSGKGRRGSRTLEKEKELSGAESPPLPPPVFIVDA